MIEKFLSASNRTKPLINNFFKYLEDFENEEKCEKITYVANELMSKGKENDIFCAEIILVYATQHYFDVCDSNYKAKVYYALGQLHELYTHSFIKSYTYYEKYALNNTVNDGSHSILLRALILRDNFTYSEQLEKELRYALGEYNLGARLDRLYENLGLLIVANNDNDTQRAEELVKKLKALIKADEFFFLDYVLTKEKEPDRLFVPQKVKDYINSL